MIHLLPPHRPRQLWPIACAALAAAACLGANVGDVLYVSRPALPIRSGVYSFDKVVARANAGDAVTVISTDGKWLKVKYAPTSAPNASIEGYVFDAALTPEKAPVPAGKSAESPGALSAALYSEARGLSPEPLAQIVADSRAAMKDADVRFDEFTRAGRVGPHRPAPATPPGK